MAATRRLDRLTASDLFLLMWDDYGWSSDIGGLAILDGGALVDAAGELRVDAVRRRLEPRVHMVPRLRQRLCRPGLGLGWPLWVDAASFDIADHVRAQPVGAPGDEAQLLRTCEALARRGLDPAQRLWELWLLPGLAGGRVGAFLRMHHALADGAAAMAAFGSLLDLDAGASDPVPPPWTPAPVPTRAELLRDNLRRRGAELGRAGSGAIHPRRTAERVRQTLPAWREVLTDKPAPHTSLNRPVGGERRLVPVRSRLDIARQIAHAHGAKVNDVVLAAVAGGLRDLLAGRGENGPAMVQRAMVTISEHQDSLQAQGNRPGWMMVPLPLGEPDAVRRLHLVATETAARKGEVRPEAGTGIFRFVAGQRVWYRMFPRQRAVNLVVTNVPGPPLPLYMAGARIVEMFPVMPVMGNLTLVVGVLSYDGQLNFTAVADTLGCPDVEVFARGLGRALDDMARSTSRELELVHP